MQHEIRIHQEEILRHQKLFLENLKGCFSSEPQDLLHLPKYLQTTALALQNPAKPKSAIEIAKITGKARAVESHYLNILVGMRKAIKWREGQRILFSPLKSMEAKE
jgi:hypothetical protein